MKAMIKIAPYIGIESPRFPPYLLWVSATLLVACGAQSGRGPTVDHDQISPATTTAMPPATASGTDAELRQQIAAQVARAWTESDFAWLDATADEYIRTEAKTYTGKWRLAIFYSSLSRQLDVVWPDDGKSSDPDSCHCNRVANPKFYKQADIRWDALRAKLDKWLTQAPQSSHARLALAQMLANRAWYYRGSGYVDTVPPEAWPLVARYLEESRKSLTARPEIRLSDPEWFDIMFFLAAAQSWPQAQVDALTEDFRKSGRHYIQAYQSAASLLLPKWGGSYEALERFAQQAIVDNGEDGFEAYVRIYWNTVPAISIQESRADWPTLKRGFEIMIRKYPDPRNLNGLAMYACAARDGSTFRQAMSRLGDNLTPESWTIAAEYCRREYGDPPA